jgi:hypothetical protein
MNEDTQIHQGFDHYAGAASANVELKKVNVAGPSAREIELQIRTGADITRNGISFIRNNRSKPLEFIKAVKLLEAAGAPKQAVAVF